MSNLETFTPIVEGIAGTAPTLFSASTTDNLATITAVGYMNDRSAQIKANDIVYINYSDTSTYPLNTGLTATFVSMKVTYSAGNWTLVATDVDSGALLAANNLSDVNSASTSATNLGLGTGNNVAFLNVQAGNSGNAGYFRSYPASASSGYFELQAANSAGNYAAILKNASLGQASTWTLADPGGASSNILQAPAALVSGNFPQASGTAGLVVDSGYNVNNVLQYASVAITAAEFNGMYAAPKLLVAAPGANKLLVVDRLELIQTYGSAAFASGGAVAAQYDSTAHLAGVLATNTEAAADFAVTASTTYAFNGVAGDTVGALPFSTTVNKGLYLSNDTGAFTTGTGSAFVAKVHYRIVATV